MKNKSTVADAVLTWVWFAVALAMTLIGVGGLLGWLAAYLYCNPDQAFAVMSVEAFVIVLVISPDLIDLSLCAKEIE